jgi:hypothetical protein
MIVSMYMATTSTRMTENHSTICIIMIVTTLKPAASNHYIIADFTDAVENVEHLKWRTVIGLASLCIYIIVISLSVYRCH